MNFFKSLFWWAWADDEDRQRVQAKQQVHAQRETGEASIDVEPNDFDNQEQEEFFD